MNTPLRPASLSISTRAAEPLIPGFAPELSVTLAELDLN
jgi:hypothetical protein